MLFHYNLMISAKNPLELDSILDELNYRFVIPEIMIQQYSDEVTGRAQTLLSSDAVHYNGTYWASEDHEKLLHDLAKTFPEATFELSGTDLEYGTDNFVKGFRGDEFQQSFAETFDPALLPNGWVPFEKRNEPAEYTVHSGDPAIPDWAIHTDWDLLQEQKQALVDASFKGTAVPSEALEGLINFLDAVGDWAEAQGLAHFPVQEMLSALDEYKPDKAAGEGRPPLDNLIAGAKERTEGAVQAPGAEKGKTDPERA